MRKLFLFIIILTFGVAVPALALDPVKAYVPFEFVVENATLLPGEYFFTQVGSLTATKIWNLDKHDGMFVMANLALRTVIPEVTTMWTEGVLSTPETGMTKGQIQPSGDAYCSVVFKKYGDHYFLNKIWTGLQGREFREGSMERQLRTAGMYGPPETIVLAARIR